LAFMVYVDQSRRDELQPGEMVTQRDVGQPIPPIAAGTR
jgi:hypothetical protein